jgi:hypothetical protein
VFKEHAAQTLLDFSKDTNNKVADTPNSNVTATPNVNAANTPTNNTIDTPTNNAVDIPTNNAVDTPANNIKDTPTKPTNLLLAALTYGPNRVNFFALKHNAKVLKDIYNNI